MKTLLGYVAAFSTLIGCAGSSKTNVIFYVDPPPDTDVGCIGVAGFDVVISSGGKDSPSQALLNSAPVLEQAACRMPLPFSVTDADLDSPASVTVTGRDGAGTPLVRGTGRVDNLHGGPAHIQLEANQNPPDPVLVINRTPLLVAAGHQLSDVTRIVVTSVMRPVTLIGVNAGDYFLVEPGAFASSNLQPGGADEGLALAADISINQGTVPRVRLTAHWKGLYYEAN